MLVRLAVVCLLAGGVAANWNEWWTYDGISGPAYWGLINPAWTMCNKGRRQSPINIAPGSLTYDPALSSLSLDKQLVSGRLDNTGQSLVLKLDRGSGQGGVNITGGPLQYQYQAEQLFLHWGRTGGAAAAGGSEHSINQQSWPAELQLYGYNSQLYSNLSHAQEQPGGVVGVSIMLQVRGDTPTSDTPSSLHRLVAKLPQVKYRGSSARVHQLSLAELLPATPDYVTYEGSTTYPGCWETVTWILMNKPLYLSRQEMALFQGLRQGDGPNMEKAPLGDNLRPRQPLNNRAVRTNIAVQGQKGEQGDACAEDLPKIVYTTNDWTHTNTNV